MMVLDFMELLGYEWSGQAGERADELRDGQRGEPVGAGAAEHDIDFGELGLDALARDLHVGQAERQFGRDPRVDVALPFGALVLHPQVAEAAVVGYPHPIKGQGIYAYVSLMAGAEPSEQLRQELMVLVSREIGAIARPDLIQWAPGLPKTRSGKIMRRILRKIAASELDNLGDTTTLADPAVVQQLIDGKLA